MSKKHFSLFKNYFKKSAFLSKKTKGRKNINDDDLDYYFMDPFLLDFIKISQSKALRRLMYKTQVFSDPLNAHTRTRRSHTDEVLTIATIISEIFGLNTYLCQAISLAHDIGHTPYGHMGEKFISQVTKRIFRHEKFAVIIAQQIERKGNGLNLNYETLMGVMMHSRGDKELTTVGKNGLPLEYDVVMYADKIAYITSDYSDYINRINSHKNIPDYILYFGKNQREMVNKCIKALIAESVSKGYINWNETEEAKNFSLFKKWMYENIYYPNNTDLHLASLEAVYDFLYKNYNCCDPAILLALMTDREVHCIANQILQGKKEFIDCANLSFLEIIPYIKNKIIDFENINLD